MFKFTSSFLALMTLAGYATAHGAPKAVVVDGKKFPGAILLNADPKNSPVRPITNSGEPIFDETSTPIICGTGATSAPVSAAAKPGSLIQVYWQGESVPNWFHTDGPIINYLAKCTGDCSTFTPSTSTQWFKISQEGESNGPNTWAQANLLSGAPANVTLPKNLPTGNYLLRHEIIALQNGLIKDKAEFYPSCIQLSVTGGSGSASPSPTVNFPGAYKDTDPGILVDVFTPGLGAYVFPGGPISSISSSGSSGSGPAAPSSSSSSHSGTSTKTSTKTATSPASSSTSTAQCKKRKRSNPADKKKRALRMHKKRRSTPE